LIEQVPEAWKKILLNRQVVYFNGSDFPDRVADKYFRIKRRQTINYSSAFILTGKTGDQPIADINLEEDAGLYPTNPKSLYEILIGIKSTQGSMLIYPRAPINDYYLTLEKGGYAPTFDSPEKRYIGSVSEETSPADKPTLRYHTVKDLNSVGLRVANDSVMDDKAVLSMVVNRCLLEEEKKENLSKKERERLREITYYNLEARGGWS